MIDFRLPSLFYWDKIHSKIGIQCNNKNFNLQLFTFLLLSYVNGHIIHPFSIFSLIFNSFFFLLIFQLIVILSLTFRLFFTFSSSYYVLYIYLNITFHLSLYLLLFFFFSYSPSFTINLQLSFPFYS